MYCFSFLYELGNIIPHGLGISFMNQKVNISSILTTTKKCKQSQKKKNVNNNISPDGWLSFVFTSNRWDKKPISNRETVKLPLLGRVAEMTRRGSMLATHVFMRFGKDPTVWITRIH